jgi:transcriptional regulator with XRE-family HTH domain
VNTALVKRDILDSIKADNEYRQAWNLENVYTGLCSQIRVLREQRGWSQKELGKQARMAQERISILEDPNAETKPTLTTLLRIADAYDVGLDVRFVAFGTVLERSTKTGNRDSEVPSFGDELPELERELEREAVLASAIETSITLPSAPRQMELTFNRGIISIDTSLLFRREQTGQTLTTISDLRVRPQMPIGSVRMDMPTRNSANAD